MITGRSEYFGDTDDRRRLHDNGGRFPILSDGHKPDAEQSVGVDSFGRFTERLEHADLVNAAPRPSNWSAARLRNQPEREAISAANTGPNGKQSITGNSQLI